ncbi:MAG: winged helix-turn-helix domain-containing protein [Dyella sp.]|uniref:winged helix-turn-helix domain-containing protein n=1 Tax=Dyella sp. TaxID=1869338 RepID=UPI003F7FFF4D
MQLELTPVEFRLLKALAANAGHMFSRDQLLDYLDLDHCVSPAVPRQPRPEPASQTGTGRDKAGSDSLDLWSRLQA